MKKRSFVVLALSIFLSRGRVFASAPPRMIRAATSSNGKFLVISSYDLALNGIRGGGETLSQTFEISKRESWNTSRDRLSAPNSYYYQDFGWKILVPATSGFIDAWPIISDDGATLILVNVTALTENQTLLAIYRRERNVSTLVRTYKRADLFTRLPNEPNVVVVWDSTPQWFAKGRFSFSRDGLALVYQDETHGSVKMRLIDGVVTRSR